MKQMKQQESAFAALQVVEISHSFGSLQVLDNISFTVPQRQVCSIVGPSGCGKSSLLHICAGIICPDYGKILLYNEDCTGTQGHVSYMRQRDMLLPWRTILDNVALPLEINGIPRKDARVQAAELFSRFGLSSFERYYPHEVSGGMRQRAALLRTYMCNRRILLLDEPFASLDDITRNSMREWLLELLDDIQVSVLFVTHDIHEAIMLSDNVAVVSARPAHVVRWVPIDLPWPRNKVSMFSDRFSVLHKEIRDALRV